MRSFRDRLRHAIFFELIALAIVTPMGAVIYGIELHAMGLVSLVCATLATLWNMGFNWVFDRGMRHVTGSTRKSGSIRILHAIAFEIGLLAVLLPFIAWYLQITLWQALVMDLSFALFYMGYAFVYNWAYDRLFPLPDWQQGAAQ